MTHELGNHHVRVLIAECKGNLEDVESDLIALESGDVHVSDDVINRMFRAFHSVKSGAAFLEIAPLKQLSHLSESVLSEVREGNLLLLNHTDVLLSATDRMNRMLCDGARHSEVDCQPELQQLNAILNGQNSVVAIPMKSTSSGPSESAATNSPLNVLVVEDDFTSRILLQGLLSKYGTCHIAVSGEEAIAAFQSASKSSRPYHLICMDIQMPGMSGSEAVTKIRSIERENNIMPGVKVIMTTSLSDMKTIVASFQAICDAYLVKPIDGRKLEESLKSFELIPAN